VFKRESLENKLERKEKMEGTVMSNVVNNLYFKALSMKSKALNFLKKENGEANLISVILILAVVIALALLFKGKIKELFEKIWGQLDTNVNGAITTY